MKLGIYGGTFSPPHVGHIEAARAFCRQISLDKLLIIPANIPPHKDFSQSVSADDRFNMCTLAFSDIECAEISDIEISRGGKSYTYMTVEALTAPDTELYLLCGTDMILTFDMWVNFERIFELATVCYVRRETDVDNDLKIAEKILKYRSKYGARIIEIDHTVMEISSTEIREAIDAEAHASMLDGRTAEYIRERGLYK